MKSWQTSIGKDAAIAMAQTDWWVGKTDREIVEFQLFTAELCMPFSEFHRAVESVLARGVFTHEFAALDHIRDEFLGEKSAPTLQDILRMIPEEKRILVVVE